MEDQVSSPLVLDGSICSIKFSIATAEEIRTYSISDCPISHPSQLANPFLGLPLESGGCETCGTAEIGNCEGHFGYIELPIPVYHPSHVSELRDLLSLVCLKCLRMKKVKYSVGKGKISSMPCLYCLDLPSISIKEVKTADGATCLELRVSSRSRLQDGFWSFLDRFGYHYAGTFRRPLLPSEALKILEKLPEETQKKLAGKGYFLQNGFIMERLPVPPNCLCVPEISDGKCVMSSDISKSLLKKILGKIELIKRSRSGSPSFESYEVETNDLQSSIALYMNLRGTTKAPRDITRRFAFGNETNEYLTKQWLDKIRTLFIRKGSGFSSRSVISGDPYIGINVVGLPSEIAKRITFEERVTEHNITRLQNVVDSRLCITYKDGSSTYAISVGSKGHTNLKIGQVINRQILDGDIVFINRPPSTHKHSLQAFYVYIHDDHTVKINPLICAPLGADFDGDCVHIFYPQSLSAKAEVLELFSVEKQLLSSHSGSLNLQLVQDASLALKLIFKSGFIKKEVAQQLGMYVSSMLPPPAIVKATKCGPCWTILQVLQNVFPAFLDCSGERYFIRESEILELDTDQDVVQSLLTDIMTHIYHMKGPMEVLNFFNYIQPLLMEMLFMEGFSICLKDFILSKAVVSEIQGSIQKNSCILNQLRSRRDERAELQVQNHLRSMKDPIVKFILNSSALGNLIDSKSDSSMVKVVEQLGFLGLQLFDQGKYYSRALVDDCFLNFVSKHSAGEVDHPSEAYGLVKNSFFHGLNPYEMLVHAISSREVIVRSSRGLTEPGTLFKNLMAILRDVVICYDGSVRNVCTGSLVQLEYVDDEGVNSVNTPPAGDPVGVLAATAISNLAYKAVLDSSQSNNSSWELMKEILLCKVSYKNDVSDRRVILYLNDCCCQKRFCKENAAFTVLNCLKRVTLKDCAHEFLIEYQKQIGVCDSSVTTSGLVGHIHLDKMQLKLLNINPDDILHKCQAVIFSYGKKKGQLSHFFRRIFLSTCKCCSIKQPSDGNLCHLPCLQFSYADANASQNNISLERAIHVMSETICPILLDTIVKGDPRVHEVKIVWIGPDATSWVGSSCKTLKGDLGLEVVLGQDAVRQSGDAWRTVLDACLPVMHLIDTGRSIPYGIQQIQEVLGISCAFDQAVQRLSKSIKMVSKGVMKEHLLLVANSMTCTGKLIGFNTGGYKALFRSFKVEVPFTAATLFTPMKCFERAAEKCQVDSLASVVSSCSWGKNVAIGTGAPFQILWDKKQMAMNKDIGKGVYDFLELLRETSSGEATGRYLADVDELAEENGICLSPDLDGCMTFDDSDDVEYNFQKRIGVVNGKSGESSWEVDPVSVKSGNWEGWGDKESTHVDNCESPATKHNVWSSWDSIQVKQKTVESENLAGDTVPGEDMDAQKHSGTADESVAWGKWKADGNSTARDKLSHRNCWNEASKTKVDLKEGSPVWNRTASSPKSKHNQDSLFSTPGTWSSQSSGKPWGQDNANNTKRNIAQDGWRCAESPVTNIWDSTSTRNANVSDSQWSGNPSKNLDIQWDGNDSNKDLDSQWCGNVTSTSNTSEGRNQSWNSRGWGSANPPGRKNQKTFSARFPGKSASQKGWNSNRALASGRRLESLTAEEEKILAEVEPVMLTIKRILHDSSDGNRLSADDQKFILENVFKYHPDKQSKVSDQVDYIMVDKNMSFQDSRCFYVVSSDGTSADFSYLKCMEGYVKQTFSEHGESFCKKYFKRRRSGPADDKNQQQ
ncbi:unnamed protein product [Musa acuminata subsp. malaccensis]|uniref:DNA-directed RNA polymerase subunit n=1 Tax=Musa acuminata subsp. malaccensis TaxID=214687 RepID=A0A804I8T3_MUSAM|nr:PREDICTED: DNA-directed RNA polymerase V subunit 1 isoform X1 [Musa acuminata subsp. malaccensis]XP_009391190.1 PREDICTED: DNA-directed RNA polymerase V subunit 1 isoform X1 [Musa acuminata subsp. malaccensis]CAG1849268.1 unnamed protein product [Musa acuminata subsp. malaccensis]